MDMPYEAPAVIALGDFTDETGWLGGRCPEQVGPIQDTSCPG